MTGPVVVGILAKPPVPGAAKTRLAPALGNVGAARLARALFDDTWAMAGALPWARRVAALPAGPDAAFGLPPGVEIWPQGPGDLGERMERLLRQALLLAPAALLIGTDLPGLPARHLEAARAALETSDAVLGPAEDGGFYLIGLRRGSKPVPRDLLAGLPWSTPHTHAATRARLRDRGLQVAELPPWFDLDVPANLLRTRAALEDPSVIAPAVRAALQALPRISVIVPTLDEEARIAAQVHALGPRAQPGLDERIVVDGGSCDRTRERAREAGEGWGLQLLQAPRGRAAQMNAGACAATGDVLLFLHADVRLPPGAAGAIRDALEAPHVVAGAFRTRTINDGHPSLLTPLLRVADVRSRYSGLPYGDQALFVRAPAFHAAGRFPPLPLMEDLALSRTLRRAGLVRTLPLEVTVSGRRWLRRPVRTTLIYNLFPLLFRMGVPADRLAQLYGHAR